MKKVLVLLLISLPCTLYAQLDMYVRHTEGASPAFNINYYGSRKLSEKFSLNYFGLLEKNWGEGLVGVSYSPIPYFSVGTMIGMEHGSDKPRYFASLWAGKGKTSLLAMAEKGAGAGNYWYRVNLYHKVSDSFTVGLTSFRFNGTGPNIRYTIPKSPYTIWTIPGYDFEFHQKRLMVGINIRMQ